MLGAEVKLCLLTKICTGTANSVLGLAKRFTELGREEKGEGGDRGDLVEKKESQKGERAITIAVVHGFLVAVSSLVAELRLYGASATAVHRFSCPGASLRKEPQQKQEPARSPAGS